MSYHGFTFYMKPAYIMLAGQFGHTLDGCVVKLKLSSPFILHSFRKQRKCLFE